MTTPISLANRLSEAQVGSYPLRHLPLAFGGSWYVPYSTAGDGDRELQTVMQTAYDLGIQHFSPTEDRMT